MRYDHFLRHLQTEDAPFEMGRKDQRPRLADAEAHQRAYEANPVFYALHALAPRVREGQKLRLLYTLLRAPRQGSRIVDRCLQHLLEALPVESVLTVFLALRRTRSRRKHACRTILRYLLNHQELERLLEVRRPTVVDCLEHALGRDRFRAQRRRLAQTGTAPLLGGDRLLGLLARLRPIPHQPRAAQDPASVTVTESNRGGLSANLVRIYRGAQGLRSRVEAEAAQLAGRLPRYPGRVTLILDASGSTAGYGDREYCCIAQSVALVRVLAHCLPNLHLVTVGATTPRGEFLPKPQGHTDLALALVQALEGEPELVIIVSDGYENVEQGDLARVVATLPQLALATPVVFCHSKFGPADDLQDRRPAPELPEVEFWHQNDFDEVVYRLLAPLEPAREALRNNLQLRLQRKEALCLA